MPVRMYAERPQPPRASTLLEELTREWESPSETDDPEVPIILINQQKRLNAIHVYVVWDKWGEMEQVDRSQVVMDAAERCLGKRNIVKVTVALGLSRQEAQRMQIDYGRPEPTGRTHLARRGRRAPARPGSPVSARPKSKAQSPKPKVTRG